MCRNSVFALVVFLCLGIGHGNNAPASAPTSKSSHTVSPSPSFSPAATPSESPASLPSISSPAPIAVPGISPTSSQAPVAVTPPGAEAIPVNPPTVASSAGIPSTSAGPGGEGLSSDTAMAMAPMSDKSGSNRMYEGRIVFTGLAVWGTLAL